MRVFELAHDHAFQHLLDEKGYCPDPLDDPLDVKNAQSRRAEWVPPRLRLVVSDKHRKRLPPSDFPAYSAGVTILSQRAVGALHDLLEPRGEILPIACETQELYFFNPTCVIDALDAERSQLERSIDDGRPYYIEKYVFKPAPLRNAVIFKIPDMTYSPVFVTAPFIERVEQAGLIGFKFPPLWFDE